MADKMSFKKVFIITLCLMLSLSGCVKLPERTIREVPEEVTSYSAEQMYLVLAGRKNEIQDVYTAKIFDVEINDAGEKYSDGVNDMIRDYLEKIHVMTEMCKERDIMLSMSDTKEVEKLLIKKYPAYTIDDVKREGFVATYILPSVISSPMLKRKEP